MARCHICDRELNKPSLNSQHGDIDPCGVCLEVINDVFHDEPPEEVVGTPETEVEATPEELMADYEAALEGRFDDP